MKNDNKNCNEKYERLVRELNNFSYAIVHDLKSPAITMRGFIDIARMHLSEGDIHSAEKDIMRVENGINKLDELLNCLGELSHGVKEDRKIPVSLKDNVNRIKNLFN